IPASTLRRSWESPERLVLRGSPSRITTPWAESRSQRPRQTPTSSSSRRLRSRRDPAMSSGTEFAKSSLGTSRYPRPRNESSHCAWTTYFSCWPRAGPRRRGGIAAPRQRSDTCRRPWASGSSAGCEGSRSQVFLDPRDILLDRVLRLLRIRGWREAHDEQGLAARVDDEVLVRLGMDHDGLERILRFIGDGHRGADEDREHRPERVDVDAAGKAAPEVRSRPGNEHRLLHALVLLDFVEKGLEGGRVDHGVGSGPADLERARG